MHFSLFSQLVRQSESAAWQDLTSDDISGSRQGAAKSLSRVLLKAFLCPPGEVCQKQGGLKSGHTLLCLGLWGSRQHCLGWICPLEYTDVSPSSFTLPRSPLNQKLNADLHSRWPSSTVGSTIHKDVVRMVGVTGWGGKKTKDLVSNPERNVCCIYFRTKTYMESHCIPHLI